MASSRGTLNHAFRKIWDLVTKTPKPQSRGWDSISFHFWVLGNECVWLVPCDDSSDSSWFKVDSSWFKRPWPDPRHQWRWGRTFRCSRSTSYSGSMSLRIPTIQNSFGLKISEPINFQFQAAFWNRPCPSRQSKVAPSGSLEVRSTPVWVDLPEHNSVLGIRDTWSSHDQVLAMSHFQDTETNSSQQDASTVCPRQRHKHTGRQQQARPGDSQRSVDKTRRRKTVS